MIDLTKLTMEVKDGIVSIINLTADQAQEIWDRCAAYEKLKQKKEECDTCHYWIETPSDDPNGDCHLEPIVQVKPSHSFCSHHKLRKIKDE